jgi:hypothetical protein
VLRKSLLYAFMLALITPPPPDLTLYRGTGNMALGPAFFARDEQGCAGGVELAIMSATPDREVAMGYAGAEAGKEPTKDLPTLYIIPVEQARGASNAGMRASGLLPVFEDSHGESLRLLFLQAHCKTEAHLTAAGMPSQRNNSDMFRFRRAVFYQSLKSKVGLAAATAAAVAD